MVSGPLALDFLTRAVNIQWESGLAVEFCPEEESTGGEISTGGLGEPSYLNMATGETATGAKRGVPDFSKAVISLWFRVPRASVIAASGHSMETQVPGFPMMQSILPLITYGTPQLNKNYQQIVEDVAVYNYEALEKHPILETSGYSENEHYDVDPCFIGAECSDDGTFRLVFNIQTGVEGSYRAIDWVTTQMDVYLDEVHPVVELGDGWLSGLGVVLKATIRDDSYIENSQPDWFYVNTTEYFDPDTWHHLLLSFDVSGSVTIGQPKASSTCKLWYAVDDEDFRGPENLQPYRDDDDDLDENVILTRTAYVKSTATPADGWLYQNTPVAAPSGTYDGELIPTGGEPLGIPAATKYVDALSRVEMAEFQMWTGVTLDTGVTANRRAFLDYKRDEKGAQIGTDLLPVSPTKGATKEDPRGLTEKLLGKKPEVLLHGNSKWKAGYNTGTIGVTVQVDPETGRETITKKPDGQFTPIGLIVTFKPEPKLTPTENTA